MQCGLREKRQRKLLPPCKRKLDAKDNCPVHCRAYTRTCRKCERRYEKNEKDLAACPKCKTPRPCIMHHVKGRIGCRMHGGTVPAGIASPLLKNGEHSRYIGGLGARMQDRYRAAQQNADLLSLNPDLWMLDARLEELVARAEAGESSARLKNALIAFEEFAAAQVAKDRDAALTALQRLADLLRKGVADYDAWDEVKDLWKQRTRMVESERKRKLETQQMVAVDYMLVMATALLAAVKRHVENQEQLAQIQSEFARITAGRTLGIGDTAQLHSGWTNPGDR